MEIKESNKLIAEFIGRAGKYNSHLYWTNVDGVQWVTVEEMKFHCSWDWLMTVIDEIETKDVLVSIDSKVVFIELDAKQHIPVQLIEDFPWHIAMIQDNKLSRLEKTYKAVVEYIKWFNEEYD